MLTMLAIAGAVFLVGNVLRVLRIARMPMPLRWELYPLPKGPRDRQRYGGSYFEETDWWTKQHEEGRSSQAAFVLREILTLHSVWEGFRSLWLWSLLLHWGMYLYMAAVACSLMNPTARLAVPVAMIGCSIGLTGVIALFVLRTVHARLREYSNRGTLFNLAVLAALFGSGVVALAGTSTLGEVLRTKHGVVPVHLAIVAFFLAYFPFTHMTHAYMKFFTWDRVRWNDEPGPAKDLRVSLRRTSTWAAPHLGGAEQESWAEVVADAGKRGGRTRA